MSIDCSYLNYFQLRRVLMSFEVKFVNLVILIILIYSRFTFKFFDEINLYCPNHFFIMLNNKIRLRNIEHLLLTNIKYS